MSDAQPQSITGEHTAFIAIGSNLNEPKRQVVSAVSAIDAHPNIKVLNVSRWYESLPVGPKQPNYINGAVQVSTSLTPLALLDALQAIEHAHGRVRKQHWGARTLDLDIALYANQMIHSERLCVPHRFLKERNFVVLPLADIDPTLVLPTNEHIKTLVELLGDSGITPIDV